MVYDYQKYVGLSEKEVDRAKVLMTQLFAGRVGDSQSVSDWRELLDIVGVPLDGKTFYSSFLEMHAQNPKLSFLEYDWAYSQKRHQVAPDKVLDYISFGREALLTMHQYLQSGEKTFYIYSDLARLLIDTDVPENLVVDDIHLPFESVMLCFKRGTLSLEDYRSEYDHICVSEHLKRFVRDEEEKWHEATLRACMPDLSENHAVFKTGKDQLKIQLDKKYSQLSDTCAVREWGIFTYGKTPAAADMLFLRLKAGKTVAELCNFVAGLHDHSKNEVTQSVQLRLLINILLYINSEKADIQRDTGIEDALKRKLEKCQQGSRKYADIQKRMHKAHKRCIYLVGKNIVADEVYQHEKDAPADVRQLMVRFRVRGHYRNQVCGTERSERKRIWIMPFWKGPTLAELINKKYVVKASTELEKENDRGY